MSPSPIDVNAKLSEFINGPTYGTLDDTQRKTIIERIRAQGAAPPSPNAALAKEPRMPKGPADMGDYISLESAPIGYSDSSIDALRPIVADAAGTGVGALAAVKGGGKGALAARAGTYSVVDALMQYLKEEKPESFSSALGEGALQAGSNVALSGLMKFITKGAKGYLSADQPEIFKFNPTTGQALTATGHPVLGAGAKALEDLSLTAKKKALDRTAGAGFTEALDLHKKLSGSSFSGSFQGRSNWSNLELNPQANLERIMSVTPGADSFSKIDSVIRDPKKLQDVLAAAQSNGVGTNLRESLRGYQFQKIFNAAADNNLEGTPTRINPQVLSKMWSDPSMQDSLKTLYNAKQRADITQFFKNIEYTQDKINTNPIAKKLIFMHGGVGLATGLLTGNIPAGATMSAVSLLGAEGLGRLLTNPKTARLMVALAGDEALGVSDRYAAKVISDVLQGMTIGMVNQDGSVTPSVVGSSQK